MVKWGNAPFSKGLRVTQMRDSRQPIGSANHFPTGTIASQAADDGLHRAGQPPKHLRRRDITPGMVDILACRRGRLTLVAETRLEMGAHVVVDALEFFLLEIVAVAADLGTTHLVGIGIVVFTRL
jgi:hypothetical protein